MIHVTEISKSFGRSTVLDGLSIDLNQGRSVALIGPNGSGKTTFIKCILGLCIPDHGDIVVANQHIKGAWTYRNMIGYMPQIGRYPDNITVRHLIDMIKSIREGHNTEHDYELYEAFNIRSFEQKTMQSLSGGMRQKVSASIAFMFNPDILILDEPTAGLDPVSSEILKEKVIREQKKGKLILITSHILSDLEEIASDIAFIHEGKLIFYKSAEELKRETGTTQLSKSISHIMQQHQYYS